MTFKEMLEKYDITMMELSKMFDIPYRTLQNWNLGLRNPPQYVLNLIEFALSKNVKDI